MLDSAGESEGKGAEEAKGKKIKNGRPGKGLLPAGMKYVSE